MEKGSDRKQIQGIVRRRKKSFLTIFFLILLIGFIVSISLPPIYKSEAMIRVEEEEVHGDFVRPTISDYVEERIQKIRQRILSQHKLMEIIEKFNPYPEIKDQKNSIEMVNKMREDITLETIVADMKSKPGGKNISFTVAFNLSYEGKDPKIVQSITDTLANLYVEEDIKNKERRASATTDFLKAELQRLKKEINHHEKRISEFKKSHLRELPADERYNLNASSRLERELDKADMQLRTLQEKKLLTESQLKKVEPLSPIVVEGEKIAINPNQRLKELNLQLMKLKSIYSEKHPDIKKIKKEINELKTQVEVSDATVDKVKRLRQLENQLSALEGKYGSRHPEVKALKNEIALLSHEVDISLTETARIKISEENPDNPAYISLITQINTINLEIKAIQKHKEEIEREIEKYEQRIQKAPFIEKEFNELTRDYETAKSKYKDLSNKLMTAKVSQELEDKKQGRRFSIASPAYLPTKPYKPNRLIIILVSLIIAIGTSFILTAVQESIDNSIKTAEELKQLTDVPVLSTISYIVTDEEKRSQRFKKFIWTFATICLIGAFLIFIDKFVIKIDQVLLKLDHVWITILERLKMIA